MQRSSFVAEQCKQVVCATHWCSIWWFRLVVIKLFRGDLLLIHCHLIVMWMKLNIISWKFCRKYFEFTGLAQGWRCERNFGWFRTSGCEVSDFWSVIIIHWTFPKLFSILLLDRVYIERGATYLFLTRSIEKSQQLLYTLQAFGPCAANDKCILRR